MLRGRFAPSPTGPLHFGSLIAATASYLEVKSQGGEWLVRMEDLDNPREVPGAADSILDMLGRFGFEWDGPVLYQSQRQEAYAQAMASLHKAGLIYPCGCSRREIADSAVQGLEGSVYPGTCRHGLGDRQARAWRIQMDGEPVAFEDGVQGMISQHLNRDIGDFVLKRADGLFPISLRWWLTTPGRALRK